MQLNHELLPVVNSKRQLLGVVTRRSLEQALGATTNASNCTCQNTWGSPGETAWISKDTVPHFNSSEQSPEALRVRTEMLHTLGLVTYCPQMLALVDLSLRVAKVNSTALVYGESGVGKELFAKLLHEQSPRSAGPFIKVNCGAIPENLLESELFGYESGAFTGANRQGKRGIFDLAHGGTLFLDEIGELPLGLQVKTLRAIQEQEFLPIGAVKPRRVDIRFVAATNRDLETMVEEGKFRGDLYFRLNVIPLHVLPLRERREDILPLVNHFQQKFARKLAMDKEFAPEVLKVFVNYHWPGNVRELENIIERLFVITPGRVVLQEHLPQRLLAAATGKQLTLGLKQAVEQFEQALIKDAIQLHGSTYRAAQALQVEQSTIVRKLAKYRIKSDLT